MKEFVELILMVYAVCPNSTPTARNLRKRPEKKWGPRKSQVRAAKISSEGVALFLATFWPLLASWSRVGANGIYHSNQLDKLFHINPTCIFSELSL